jgi:hypothetical protein
MGTQRNSIMEKPIDVPCRTVRLRAAIDNECPAAVALEPGVSFSYLTGAGILSVRR